MVRKPQLDLPQLSQNEQLQQYMQERLCIVALYEKRWLVMMGLPNYLVLELVTGLYILHMDPSSDLLFQGPPHLQDVFFRI